MLGFNALVRFLVAATLLISAFSTAPLIADNAQVIFDLPETIECRDVTPKDFAAAHPSLKVIEGKFRVSARIVVGVESDIVDFLYIVASPDRKMRFQDYLPNTTLESTAVDNVIEVTDTIENTDATDANARVGYKSSGFGISKNKGSKKTEATHSKQIAAKALVVASGTTGHEHGIFFKMRPSKGESLEGAKQFTFLATVPMAWRGDWCTISCAARAKGKVFFSRSVVAAAGVEQTQVGMFLAGDSEAAKLANELRSVLEMHADVLAMHLTKDADGLLETMNEIFSTGLTTTLCGVFKGKNVEAKKGADPERTKLEEAQEAVSDVQERLTQLAGRDSQEQRLPSP
jgi:hypothetical protein